MKEALDVGRAQLVYLHDYGTITTSIRLAQSYEIIS